MKFNCNHIIDINDDNFNEQWMIYYNIGNHVFNNINTSSLDIKSDIDTFKLFLGWWILFNIQYKN